MASPYVGNPTATESPDGKPMPGTPPTISLPASTDGGVVANWYQAHKRAADGLAYFSQPGRMKQHRWNFKGAGGAYVNNPTTPLQDPSLTIYLVGTGGGGSFVSMASGGTITLPQTYGGIWAQLNAGLSASRLARITTDSTAWWYPSMTFAQVQFEVDLAIVDVTKGTYSFGLTDTQGTNVLTHHGIYLQKAESTSHWSVQIGGSAFLATVTGFDPANNTYQRHRLMIYGSATPKGVANSNTAVFEWYVNDVLAYSNVGALTDSAGGTPFYPFIDSLAASGNGANAYYSEPIISWNAW